MIILQQKLHWHSLQFIIVIKTKLNLFGIQPRTLKTHWNYNCLLQHYYCKLNIFEVIIVKINPK